MRGASVEEEQPVSSLSTQSVPTTPTRVSTDEVSSKPLQNGDRSALSTETTQMVESLEERRARIRAARRRDSEATIKESEATKKDVTAEPTNGSTLPPTKETEPSTTTATPQSGSDRLGALPTTPQSGSDRLGAPPPKVNGVSTREQVESAQTERTRSRPNRTDAAEKPPPQQQTNGIASPLRNDSLTNGDESSEFLWGKVSSGNILVAPKFCNALYGLNYRLPNGT